VKKDGLTLGRALLIVLVVVVVGIVAAYAYASLTGPSSPLTGHTFQVSDEQLSTVYYSNSTAAGVVVNLGATVTDTGNVPLTSVAVWINGVYLGSCSAELLPGHHGPCGFSQAVSCSSLSGGLPYNMKAQAVFQDGKTTTINWNELPSYLIGSC
jgi:hypothetical protein